MSITQYLQVPLFPLKINSRSHKSWVVFKSFRHRTASLYQAVPGQPTTLLLPLSLRFLTFAGNVGTSQSLAHTPLAVESIREQKEKQMLLKSSCTGAPSPRKFPKPLGLQNEKQPRTCQSPTASLVLGGSWREECDRSNSEGEAAGGGGGRAGLSALTGTADTVSAPCCVTEP